MGKKVVLITGASSGIGKETAKLLVKNGHIVYGAARRIDKMNDLKEAGIKLLEMDVTNDESMVIGIQKIIKTEKRIDILVNNAGYGSFGALEDVPISEAKSSAVYSELERFLSKMVCKRSMNFSSAELITISTGFNTNS